MVPIRLANLQRLLLSKSLNIFKILFSLFVRVLSHLCDVHKNFGKRFQENQLHAN